MKKVYQSPTLKVVEIKVERGFQASGSFSLNTTNMEEFQMEFDDNGPRNEAYTFGDFEWN